MESSDKLYQLTRPHYYTAIRVAENINKDYPNQAIIKNDRCYVTAAYWEYCKYYVKRHCKTKK